jgi:AcrR family transcriptional regulator
MGTGVSGVTERNKLRTRREIATAAGRLFIERGYSATTVRDIAVAAEVSPRTFFRYFPTKEDVITVIASASMDDALDHLAEHNESDSLESVIKAVLRASLIPVRENPENARAFQFMLRDTPALRARWLEEQRKNRDRLADALRPWLDHEAHPLAAHIVAGTVLLVIDEVMTMWADDASISDPLGLLDEALRILKGPSLFSSPQQG